MLMFQSHGAKGQKGPRPRDLGAWKGQRGRGGNTGAGEQGGAGFESRRRRLSGSVPKRDHAWCPAPPPPGASPGAFFVDHGMVGQIMRMKRTEHRSG